MASARPRPGTTTTRELFDRSLAARARYSAYLREVANGERPADEAERQRLQAAYELALNDYVEAGRDWQQGLGASGRRSDQSSRRL